MWGLGERKSLTAREPNLPSPASSWTWTEAPLPRIGDSLAAVAHVHPGGNTAESLLAAVSAAAAAAAAAPAHAQARRRCLPCYTSGCPMRFDRRTSRILGGPRSEEPSAAAAAAGTGCLTTTRGRFVLKSSLKLGCC